MTGKIIITIGDIKMEAELNDSQTAKTIWVELPLTSQCNTWGNEIYFSIPAAVEPDRGQEVVGMGDLAFWPPGNVFCIFFGTTPMSQGQEIRPASEVYVFGRINGDVTPLKRVTSGTRITVKKKGTENSAH